jgi:hypothetical protein
MTGEEIINKILNELEIKAPTFAEQIGVLYQRVFDVQRGKTKKISSQLANAIIKVYPQFNLTWILTGEGKMLNTSKTDAPISQIINSEDELVAALDKGIKLLPEVDFKFAAGQIELINGTENVKRYWFLPDCKDCEAVAQIAGDSMSPAYPSGCWVALKKYGFSSDDATQIPFGNVFGIVVQDKFTGDYHGHIKILRRYKDQELCRKYWIAHSLNDSEYDDFDIEIAQVRSLWVVKQHIVSDILL